MVDGLNMLILSVGTRNKLVEYFRKELRGRGEVMAADCSMYSPGLYAADKHFIIPGITDEGYLEAVLSICRNHRVKAVFSLIDPELSLLARHRDAFLEWGTMPIVSGYDQVEMCHNKYAMYQFLTLHGFQTVKSYIDREVFYGDVDAGMICYPVLTKPVRGSASLHINQVRSREEMDLFFGRVEDLMIQEFADGVEYGADVYVDLVSGEPTAIFTKEKIRMRAGETDKSVSMKDDALFELIRRLVRVAGFRGMIDIDIMKVDGHYRIIEVNPRFGGGYPHAHECGMNVPRMIIRNLEGAANEDLTGGYDAGVVMMKHSDVMIVKETG